MAPGRDRSEPALLLKDWISCKAGHPRSFCCSHRYPGRLWPTDCWVDDRCRLGGRSCVDHTPEEAVERALLELLEEAL